MQEFNVLISSAGRRVALVRIFRRTLRELGLRGRVLAVDMSPVSPAFHEADAAWTVPPCSNPEFIPQVMERCRAENVRCVVPTIDPELPAYAEHRREFEARGIAVAVSSSEVIAIGNDKALAYPWLKERGFTSLRQFDPRQLSAGELGALEFPLIAKPRFGSASIGVRRIENREQLEAVARNEHQEDYLVQTLAPGAEYTIDLLIDRQGRCRCAVPRKRLEVRSGEVSKGVTERHPALIRLAHRLGEALPGAYGVLNVQVFWDPATGSANAIEINPRFGGGFPLTWEAGGHYPRWMLEEILQRPSTACCDRWTDGLMMLRFDDAVFVPAARAGLRGAA